MPIRSKIRKGERWHSALSCSHLPRWAPVRGCIGSESTGFWGDTVEWTNSDILQHTATATDGSFDGDLPAGATGRTILKRAGGVTYVCRFHPGMKGRLEVAP